MGRADLVVDFGSFKSLKDTFENTFDHKTLVAEDDPELDWFKEAHQRKVLDLVIVPAVGCEKFAEMIYEVTECWLMDNGYAPRCSLVSVEVREHGANSSVFSRSSSLEARWQRGDALARGDHSG